MSSAQLSPRRWPRRLVAVAVSLLLALGVAEGALRMLSPPSYRQVRSEYGFVRLPQGMLGFPPGGRVSFQWDGDPYGVLPADARLDVRLNAAGLRGPLPDGTAPVVLFVGDSFTFGEGVEEPDTFVGRLRAGSAGTFAPVNTGIPGYGTPEQFARLGEWVARFRPRAVVLVYGLNDVVPLGDSLERGADLLHVEEGGSSLRLVDLWRRAQADDATEAWYREYYTGSKSAAWTQARQAILRAHRKLAAEGVAFGVVLFPMLHELDDSPFAGLHGLVRDACAEGDVPFLDLLETFEGGDASSWWVHPQDHHPNLRAHERAAQAMGPFVERLLGR
jgi:GDSL-like lipase/acylhydrolase family protein